MRRRLRVLHVMHDSRRSGVPAVAAAAMRAMRREVEAEAFFAYDGIYADDLRAEGIPARTIGRRLPLVWRTYRFLMVFRLLFESRRYDIIHIHSVKLAHLVPFLKLAGGCVVFHLHELPARIGLLLRHAVGASDAVVFCSKACEDHYSAVPARRRRTIRNAMIFSDAPPAEGVAKSRKIVMAASLNMAKGQHFLLEAFSVMENRGSELWLYGTTGISAKAYVARLRKFVRRHDLDRRVFFPGPTADMANVFRDAAVVVHTSMNESFGMVVLEALAAGVPVVAHDVGGIREIVDDGVSGFLVPPGDCWALAARIAALLESPEIRQRMGRAGWISARERFDMMKRVPEFMDLYRSVVHPATRMPVS